jgi:catalase-peroxidase
MSKCPYNHTQAAAASASWWPNQLNLKALGSAPPPAAANGAAVGGGGKSYAEEFNTLDLGALKQDLFALMTTSQDW